MTEINASVQPKSFFAGTVSSVEEQGLCCFHCGLPISGQKYLEQEKQFCCAGCLAVYQLLSSSGMQQFYELQSMPGNAISNEGGEKTYAYLDDPVLQKHLFQFCEGDHVVIRLKVPSIHCISCVWLLENLHRLDAGVRKATVNFLKKEVRVHFNISLLPLSKLAHLLEKIGYPAEFKWNHFKRTSFFEEHSDIVKLGVAGFCFGNVMMLAFPEYFTIEVPHKYKYFFGFVSLLLCLPAMFYSAKDWFTQAYKAIENRHFSLDIPIVNGLLVLFAISCYEVMIHHQGGYQDTLCAFVFFMLLARYFQRLTFDHLSFDGGTLSYFPMSVTLVKEERSTIPLMQIQINDTLYLRNAEVIPVDSILLSDSCLVDYSYLTGESQEVWVERGAMLYAGGKVCGKAIEIKVIQTVKKEILEQIWEDGERKSHKTKVSFADKISPYFMIFVYSLALIGGLWQWYDSHDFNMALFSFSSVLIITCPCALAISAPLVHGLMQRKLSKKGFFLRNGSLIENLYKIDTIVFDKTGTITESGKELKSIFDITNQEDRFAIASLASNSLHPISRKLANQEQKRLEITDYEEVVSCGIKGNANGKIVQLGNKEWLEKSGFELPQACQQRGSSLLVVVCDQKVVQVFETCDVFRNHWQTTIQQLRAYYDLHVLSGDTDQARETLSREFLKPAQLQFRQNPNDKQKYIQNLKENRLRVMMVGDGLNDQFALQEADIGVAVTEAAGHFSPDSDIILEAKSWSRLNDFLAIAKSSVKLIHVNFMISLIYNVLGILVAAMGLLTPLFTAILMPISSLTVVVSAVFGSQLIVKLRKL